MDHSLRRQADVFLMESLLVQLISLQNMRGLTVDLPIAVLIFLLFFPLRNAEKGARCISTRLPNLYNASGLIRYVPRVNGLASRYEWPKGT